MQRGRRGGRGRNPNPARGASVRGDRSNSNSAASRSRLRASNLRRSARLAQLLNGGELEAAAANLEEEREEQEDEASTSASASAPVNSNQSATNGVMADVARPRPLGNRSARTRHHNGHSTGPSRSGRHSQSPEDIRYAMDVVLQPPQTARAGYPLSGSIIVRLRTPNADPDDAIADSTNLVAVATLVPGGPNSTSPTDPAILNSLLAGRRFDSIHPFSDDEADGHIGSMEMDDPRGVGYMHFPELTIRQAGSYRIRITLIRIRNSNSDPPVSSASGGASIQTVDSNPIIVQTSGTPSSNLTAYNGGGIDDSDDDGGWLDVLRTIQTRRRSPPLR